MLLRLNIVHHISFTLIRIIYAHICFLLIYVQISAVEECTICQEYLTMPVQLIQCSHFYCQSCIIQWLETNNSCPICRKAITVDPMLWDDTSYTYKKLY